MTMKFNVLQVSDKPLMSIMGDRISPETMAKRNTLFLNLLQVLLALFWRCLTSNHTDVCMKTMMLTYIYCR